jgi:WD40 repeat protein
MRCFKCNYQGLPPGTKFCTKCGTDLLPLSPDCLPAGTRLKDDTYEIDYVLGQGAFGITYKAHHLKLKQPVAIKEYYPQEAFVRRDNAHGTLTVPQNKQEIFQSWLERFIREGRILAMLNHPNLVNVKDLFEEQGTAYLVMEFVPGKTLREELAVAQTLPPEQVTEIMDSLVDALDIAHQQKVYHLDIKPDNVLLTPERRVVLIDFGSAKLGRTTQSQETTLAFTRDYAPWELIYQKEFGPESDIFELGMMLHEMLTGTLPESVMGQMSGKNWQPNLAEPWQSLVKAALVVDKDQRTKNIRQWWESNLKNVPVNIGKRTNLGKSGPALSKVSGVFPVQQLRGNFILPKLTNQGMVDRLGQGTIKEVIPLNQDLAIIIDTVITQLFEFSSHNSLWEIDCPAQGGAVSADGQLLALYENQTIYLWDLSTGQFLHQLTKHTESVNTVAFSPDGQTLASGSKDKTVRLWNISKRKQLLQLTEHTDSVNTLAFSPDGQTLASSESNTVRLWNVENGEKLQQFTEPEYVHSVAFSPDGKTLAFGSSNTVCWKNVATREKLRHFNRVSSINSVAFSPDGEILATRNNNYIHLWDVRISDSALKIPFISQSVKIPFKSKCVGTQIHQFTAHHKSIEKVAFSPDGKTLASRSDDSIRLWNVVKGEQLHEHTRNIWSVISLAFLNSQTLVIEREDGIVLLHNRVTLESIWEFTAEQSGHRRRSVSVTKVVFSPDVRFFASADDHLVQRRDVATKGKLDRSRYIHHSVTTLAWSPDGQTLAFGSEYGAVWRWDLTTKKQRRLLPNHRSDASVNSLVFSPDSKTLAYGSKDRIVRIWDLEDHKQSLQLEGHTSSVNSVAFSPDSKIVASGSDDKTVRLWNVETGEQLHVFSEHQKCVNSVAFSPNNYILASGSEDKTVVIWDAKNGKKLDQLTGHTESVNSVAFSPDGKTLVSGGGDGVVRFWEISQYY